MKYNWILLVPALMALTNQFTQVIAQSNFTEVVKPSTPEDDSKPNSDSVPDLTSINGYIIDDRVHAHVTLADSDGAFGGHLEHGTTVFTFAIVTIGILKEVTDILWIDDKTFR